MINQQLDLFFNSLPKSMALILVIVISLIGLAVATGITILFINQFFKIRWKLLSVWHRIRITNHGNIASSFRIQACSPENELTFAFYYLGKQLPLFMVPPSLPSDTNLKDQQSFRQNSSKSTRTERNSEILQNPAMKEKIGSDGSLQNLSKTAEEAKKKTEKSLGKMKLFGTILSTLGSLLPGSLGTSLKEQSTAVQNKAQSIGATVQMPEEKLKTAQALKEQTKNLKTGENSPLSTLQKPALPESNTAGNSSIDKYQQAEIENAINAPSMDHSVLSYPVIENSDPFIQSSQILPDKTLELDIRIDPVNQYHSRAYPFSILVTAIPTDTVAITNLPEPTNLSQIISIKGVSPIYRCLSYFLSMIIAALNLIWLAFLVSRLITFIS